jgi:hypothetical protein
MPREIEGRVSETDASDVVVPTAAPALDPWRLGAWTGELLRVPGGLLDAYLPIRTGINARTREQLILAVSDVNGARASAWVHGAWLDYLGARDPDDALVPLFDYARACAEAGAPLDTTTLDASYPPTVVRSVRATVAVAQLGNLVGNTADGLVARVQGRPTTRLHVPEAVSFGLSLPLFVPTVTIATTMKLLTRLAPALPTVELPPATEANMVVHLLAEAAPTYLSHALVRASLVWSPVSAAVAFRMDGTAATIRVGKGRVTISNGVERDVLAVVDGGVEPLLQLVAGSILRDLGMPVRRRRDAG